MTVALPFSCYRPLPVKVPDGLLLALLTIVSDPVYATAAVGLKVTLRLQALPAATVEQLPRVAENGAPVVIAEVMASGVAPVFVTRTLAVLLVPITLVPKPALAMVAVVAAIVPVPVTVMVEGDATALWKMETVAVLAPVVAGLNCTLTVHEPPGKTLGLV